MWANTYEEALEEWQEIRSKSKDLPIEESLTLIHDWVQQVPTIPHYLHIDDYLQWPGPWELLADNSFCEVAKALLIVYTIILTDREDIYSLHLLQDDNYTYIKVLTNNKKYILNDVPGDITTSIEDKNILHIIDCEYFKNKIL